jgi:hypothetical protein
MNHADSIFRYYQEVKDFKSIVYFKGQMSQEILGELGSMIKYSWSSESNVKRIFSTFIEIAQNILHYSAEKYKDVDGVSRGVGIIVVNEEATRFCLSSGNLIENRSVQEIKEKFDYVNSLNKDELKKLYKEKIKGERPEESKGAGLGFVDIARKSDSKLYYKIDLVDETHSFLTLSVYFDKVR